MNQELLDLVLKDMAIPPDSTHGIEHWERVERNGLYLAESTRANKAVVSLFALFHDCRRVNTGVDNGHGMRAAKLAIELRDIINIREDPFGLLVVACAGHTDIPFYNDPTIATCWDADRLDLGRVNVVPDKKFLNTDMAKRLSMSTETENVIAYKNVKRISEGVFISYYDGKTKYSIGDTIESDTGIYIYLTKESADKGVYVDKPDSYQIELLIDSLDDVRASKKKRHYVPRAKFIRVIKANGEG